VKDVYRSPDDWDESIVNLLALRKKMAVAGIGWVGWRRGQQTQAHVQGSLPVPRLSRRAAAGSALIIQRRCGRNHRLRFRAAARSRRTWALATPARGGELARRCRPRREPRAVKPGDL